MKTPNRIVVQYVRWDLGVERLAMAVFDVDGSEEFSDWESGDIRWFRFSPTPEEREFVLNMALGNGLPNAASFQPLTDRPAIAA
jgi:hypothetical protein